MVRKIRATLACRSLAAWPTPLEAAPALAPLAGVDALWLKREDRAGGSKVRGLEFLLANAVPGTVFVTIGGTGSTHCLATAVHAARVGGRAVVAQFAQPPSDTAAVVAAACRARAAAVVQSRSLAGLPLAVLRAWRVAGRLGPRRWIPGGGATPAGVIGQFLGGLELAGQLPEPPDAVVAPLGSSGTVAGLALALAALQWPTRVVGVRVASRVVASGWHAASLAFRARHLLGPIVELPRPRVPLVWDGLGRGYGHPTPAGEAARRDAARQGLILDSTYSAKAFAALPAIAALGFRRVVFWHTFAPPAPVEPS